jgi:hypothetical protein
VHLRQWTLWRQPKRLIAYMLGGELLAISLIVLATVTAPMPAPVDWLRFGTLVFCSTVHLQLSRRQEEAMRSRKPNVHIDLVGIWSFAAIVVLPVHLAVLSILLGRTQRWFVGRRPLWRYVFSSSSMLLAALASHQVVAAFGPRSLSALTVPGSFTEFGILVLAGLTYFTVQAIIVATGLILLSSSRPTLAVLGTKDDNELEARSCW